MTANLTFLGLVRGYHMKYLLSCCSQCRKSYGLWRPSKVGTSNLMLFKYWSSVLCVLQLSLGGTGVSQFWMVLVQSLTWPTSRGQRVVFAHLAYSMCYGSKLSYYVGKRYCRLRLHRSRENFTRLS